MFYSNIDHLEMYKDYQGENINEMVAVILAAVHELVRVVQEAYNTQRLTISECESMRRDIAQMMPLIMSFKYNAHLTDENRELIEEALELHGDLIARLAKFLHSSSIKN